MKERITFLFNHTYTQKYLQVNKMGPGYIFQREKKEKTTEKKQSVNIFTNLSDYSTFAHRSLN